MAVFGTPDVLHKVPQLLAESCQDFILILHRLYRGVSARALRNCERCSITHTVQEWDQFISRPLRAQGQRNCREPLDGIKTEKDIIVLSEFVSALQFIPPLCPLQPLGESNLQFVDQDGYGIELITRVLSIHILHDFSYEHRP
jgi:hypothetical protein